MAILDFFITSILFLKLIFPRFFTPFTSKISPYAIMLIPSLTIHCVIFLKKLLFLLLCFLKYTTTSFVFICVIFFFFFKYFKTKLNFLLGSFFFT